MRHSKPHKRRHTQSSDGRSRVVHGIIADIAVLAIDNYTLLEMIVSQS